MNSQKDKFEVLHLRGENVLAYKARHFALLAVATYNNPFSEFRIYGYIVHIVIAWTSLFHAIFQQQKKPFFYIDKNTGMPKKQDGDDKAWELGHCIEEYWKSTNSPIKSNLEFLIELRNKIEHRMLPALDMKIYGHCQACLLNFEEMIVEKFGGDYVLSASLAIALQLTQLSEDAQVKAMKRLQTKQYNLIKNFMDSFEEELPEEILKSEKYRLRLLLTAKPSNHKTSADLTLQFVKYNEEDLDAISNSSKFVEVVKRKTEIVEKLEHSLRPGEVVERVQKQLQKKFIMAYHTNAWKIYEIKPGIKKSDKCNKLYVKWSDLTKSYLYSEEWVNFLIKNLANEAEYARITKNSN